MPLVSGFTAGLFFFSLSLFFFFFFLNSSKRGEYPSYLISSQTGVTQHGERHRFTKFISGWFQQTQWTSFTSEFTTGWGLTSKHRQWVDGGGCPWFQNSPPAVFSRVDCVGLHVRHSLVSAYSVDGTRKAPDFLITDVLWPLTAEHPDLYAFFFFSLKQERVCQLQQTK